MDLPEPDTRFSSILRKVDEIAKEYNLAESYRSAPMYSKDNKSVEVKAAFHRRDENSRIIDDGVKWMFLVGHRFVMRKGKQAEELYVKGPYEDHSYQFWTDRVKRYEEDRTNMLVIDGHFYTVKSDLEIRDRDMAGHGGQQFRIRLVVGPSSPVLTSDLNIAVEGDRFVLTTRNLWSGGTIPEFFRGQLPNNAEFLP